MKTETTLICPSCERNLRYKQIVSDAPPDEKDFMMGVLSSLIALEQSLIARSCPAVTDTSVENGEEGLAFVVGKYYKTRDGRKAYVIAMANEGKYNVFGKVLDHNGIWNNCSWGDDGHSMRSSSYDLVAALKEDFS